MTKILWFVIVILAFTVAVLAWILFATPAHAPTTEDLSQGEVQPPPAPTVDPNAPLRDRVILSAPMPGGVVGRNFTVLGEAPGNWYFEASFPIKVLDGNGAVLANSYAQAQEEWMTTEQVPFRGEVAIERDYSGPATLVFMKDNPSGLPEHDDAVEFPIVIQ